MQGQKSNSHPINNPTVHMSSSSKLVRTVALIATGHLILPCYETLESLKKIYQPHTFWRKLKFQIFPPKKL